MRKHSLLIVLISFITAGALGLACIVGGLIVQNSAAKHYNDRLNEILNPLQNIRYTFMQYGVGESTGKAVELFVKRIEDHSSSMKNVVIVDQRGKIQYKWCDTFLRAPGGILNMAWLDRNAVMIDNSSGNQYWFRIESLDGERTVPGISSEQPVYFGYMKKSLEDLRHMLRNYDGMDTKAVVTIQEMEKGKETYYLLWFREANVDEDIAAALGSRSSSPFWSVSMPIGLSLILLYWLLAPVWVFLDARRREAQPLPWALLVLLTNIVGLAVYWIYQTQTAKTPPAYVCHACGKAVGRDHLFCPWCATSLAGVCKHCGKALENGWVSCPWCGKPVE